MPLGEDTAIIDKGLAQITQANAEAAEVYLGQSLATTGRVELTGKTLSVGSALYVGYLGMGTFSQNGGSVSAWSGVLVGAGWGGVGGTGVYLMSGGTLTNSANWSGLYVGRLGRGTFVQLGGKVETTPGSVEVGFHSGSYGTYHLSGGELHPDTAYIGRYFGATGELLMTGDSSWMHADDLYVGYAGAGTFTQSGGLVASDRLALGGGCGGSDPNTGVGVYVMAGGTLHCGDMSYVGSTGRGTFIQTGGQVDATTCIDIGYYSGSFGFYQLSGGTLLCSDNPTIGTNSEACGSMLVTGTGYLKYDKTPVLVGDNGRGTFTQDGSATLVRGEGVADVWVGADTGEGVYEMRAGSLLVPNNLKVGGCLNEWSTGVGYFEQTGGTVIVDGTIMLGESPGSRGTYELSEGKSGAPDIIVGDEGSGFFYVYGGSLLATDAVVGEGAEGQIDQLTGVCQISETLTLGKYAGSRGTYTLEDGPCLLNNVVVGDWGFGRFQQWGNYVDIAGTLMLANQTGSRGTYFLEFGELNADTILAGAGEEAVFILAGGSLRYEGTFGPTLMNAEGVFAPNGSDLGTVVFTRTPDGYIQEYGGVLEVTVNDAGSSSVIDTLSVEGNCALSGELVGALTAPANRPNKRYKAWRLITAGGNVTGSFTHFGEQNMCDTSYNKTYPNDPSGYGPFRGHVTEDGKEYHLTFLGYTKGDCTGDNSVDGGDLAVLGGHWGMSGMTWSQGDFTGEGIVDGGDLALLGGNWNWQSGVPPTPDTCELCQQGKGLGGEGGGKFDDGGLDLSDRDGDGDFDVDDMLIIIEEMHKPPADDSKSVDPSPDEIAPPPDPNLPPPWTDTQSRGGSLTLPLSAAVLDSPLFWPACWIGGIATLFRPRRRIR